MTKKALSALWLFAGAAVWKNAAADSTEGWRNVIAKLTFDGICICARDKNDQHFLDIIPILGASLSVNSAKNLADPSLGSG